MAPSFGRSISFPLSPARSSSSSKEKGKGNKAAARHVRSISLPSSRTHPLLAHLQTTVRAAQPASAPAGLAHIAAVAELLLLLLLLPKETTSSFAEDSSLLDAFLVLADAYGAFQEAVVELKRHAADVQAALRRRDAARLASAVRAQRQAHKDVARIASSSILRNLFIRPPHAPQPLQIEVVEVSGVLAEAVSCIASASAAVFSAVEFISSAATTAAAATASSLSSSSKKATTNIISLVKRKSTASSSSSSSSDNQEKELAALQRLQDLHDCIDQIEAGSDKVFRTILHTRVALLNIQTNNTC
ncbi:hypothetical protein PR202_ga14325 [Eleusine coracana subsp. coracana]|uniref:Uncharacterized protein n=1 Tax=Eleusine coracana subsp. coracana TaxID=191504 RepID=A0AAV5CH81_ELECO|nr:hypothetical protein PR202_ga14325 [Eleusine coracana subsp. coracana]